MAGHIDHGKTTLTQALTGVDTDRLKAEKERHISIEPGFAPLVQDEQMEASIIDVPGHERFIRQMIAGVAGIDIVVLVIAGDEGIMPQTKEHVDILSLLGIKHGFIVITKVDETDDDLLDIIADDLNDYMKHTFLADAPIYFVDSVSQKGISELKLALKEKLQTMTKDHKQAPFRLPIDQVFTVKGQGVVVRGTIFNGEVSEGDHLTLLPSGENVRIKQIQRHHERKETAFLGQRAALNLGGVDYNDISRGDVLVASDFYTASKRIDVVFYPLQHIKHPIKQRQPIKFHIGTSEVMGKIIFFDRNEVDMSYNEPILCQIQLEEKVVATRGDRFILRRPTPVETIGGGWVIDPQATKHRFSQETIDALIVKKEGTVKDRVLALFKEASVLTDKDIMKGASITIDEFKQNKNYLLEIEKGKFTHCSVIDRVKKDILNVLDSYHNRYSMRQGMNKAVIHSTLNKPDSIIDYVIQVLHEQRYIKVVDQYIALDYFKPSLPPTWKTELKQIESMLRQQGMEVEKWHDLLQPYDIPSHIEKDFYNFLLEEKKAFIFDENRLISSEAVERAQQVLAEGTQYEDFSLQTARNILQLTRKNLIPMLELLDRLGYTRRVDNIRQWIKRS